MKNLLSTGFCLLLAISLFAGCGGGNSAIPIKTPTPATPRPCPSGLACLSLVATPPPQTGNVGQPFLFDPLAFVQGGVCCYTASIKFGTLPAGLTQRSGGAVVGIPTATAVATAIIFTVTDSEIPPASVDVPLSLTINPMLPLTISPASGALPGGRVGNPYNHTCIFGHCHSGFLMGGSGGVQGSVPYIFSWSAATGSSLVPGLSMTSGGYISGTPTAAGTYNFAVTVTDFESPPQTVSGNYTIAVSP